MPAGEPRRARARPRARPPRRPEDRVEEARDRAAPAADARGARDGACGWSPLRGTSAPSSWQPVRRRPAAGPGAPGLPGGAPAPRTRRGRRTGRHANQPRPTSLLSHGPQGCVLLRGCHVPAATTSSGRVESGPKLPTTRYPARTASPGCRSRDLARPPRHGEHVNSGRNLRESAQEAICLALLGAGTRRRYPAPSAPPHPGCAA